MNGTLEAVTAMLATSACTSHTSEVERSVLAAAQHGDHAAFACIVRHYEARLRVLTYHVLGDSQAMDDALQETFLKAFRALPRFRGDSGLGTWLHSIACRVCLQQLRSGGRAARLAERAAETAPGESRDHADAVLAGCDVATALRSLTAEQRLLVLLIDREGYDYTAVAELLSMPRGTVASRLSAARHALRAALMPGEADSQTIIPPTAPPSASPEVSR